MLKERLKSLRKSLKMGSAKELANSLNIAEYKIKDIESGKVKSLKAEYAENLEEKFSVNGWWLLTGKGEMFLNDEKSSNIVNNGVGIVGHNSIAVGGTINGNININTSDYNHADDIKEIIELLKFAPSGFLTIIKDKLKSFKKMSAF